MVFAYLSLMDSYDLGFCIPRKATVMANRRMIAKTIVESDAFLDMPISARLLYYDLNMRADDDGFVNAPKKVLRETGATTDDIGILITKKFVIPFESGIVVIKHWKIHNYIQADRYTETKYKKEKSELLLDENKAYTKSLEIEQSEPCIQNVYSLDTQVRLDKDSIGKSNRFTPPTVEQVKEYCLERNNLISAETFVDFYESKGWLIGSSKMKDWKAAVRTWENKNKATQSSSVNEKELAYQKAMGEIRGK